MKKAVVISTDPIADMLTRIRNGLAVGKTKVSLPHSNVCETVAKALADNGYVRGVMVDQDDDRKHLEVVLSDEHGTSPITELTRLSTPGRRMYVKASAIPVVRRGRGVVIISTSHGIMTGESAKAKGLGGELILQVY
ncbi:MAG: 30S ribosomal protein S8 [Candidatus Saccharimonadales bacterium]